MLKKQAVIYVDNSLFGQRSSWTKKECLRFTSHGRIKILAPDWVYMGWTPVWLAIICFQGGVNQLPLWLPSSGPSLQSDVTLMCLTKTAILPHLVSFTMWHYFSLIALSGWCDLQLQMPPMHWPLCICQPPALAENYIKCLPQLIAQYEC